MIYESIVRFPSSPCIDIFKMKSFLLPFALFAASTAVAQTTSCAADYIVEACLASESAKLASCQHIDYACKCEQYKNILTYAVSPVLDLGRC